MASLNDIPANLVVNPDPLKFAHWVKSLRWAPISYRRRLIKIFEVNCLKILSPKQIKIALTGAEAD